MKLRPLLVGFLVILVMAEAQTGDTTQTGDTNNKPANQTALNVNTTTPEIISQGPDITTETTSGAQQKANNPVTTIINVTEPITTLQNETKHVPTEKKETKPVGTKPVPTERKETKPVPTERKETKPVPTERKETKPVPTERKETKEDKLRKEKLEKEKLRKEKLAKKRAEFQVLKKWALNPKKAIVDTVREGAPSLDANSKEIFGAIDNMSEKELADSLHKGGTDAKVAEKTARKMEQGKLPLVNFFMKFRNVIVNDKFKQVFGGHLKNRINSSRENLAKAMASNEKQDKSETILKLTQHISQPARLPELFTNTVLNYMADKNQKDTPVNEEDQEKRVKAEAAFKRWQGMRRLQWQKNRPYRIFALILSILFSYLLWRRYREVIVSALIFLILPEMVFWGCCLTINDGPMPLDRVPQPLLIFCMFAIIYIYYRTEVLDRRFAKEDAEAEAALQENMIAPLEEIVVEQPETRRETNKSIGTVFNLSDDDMSESESESDYSDSDDLEAPEVESDVGPLVDVDAPEIVIIPNLPHQYDESDDNTDLEEFAEEHWSIY